MKIAVVGLSHHTALPLRSSECSRNRCARSPPTADFSDGWPLGSLHRFDVQSTPEVYASGPAT